MNSSPDPTLVPDSDSAVPSQTGSTSVVPAAAAAAAAAVAEPLATEAVNVAIEPDIDVADFCCCQ